jgi:hypothetical protein
VEVDTIEFTKETAEMFYRKKDFNTANQILNTTVPVRIKCKCISRTSRIKRLYLISEQGKIDEAEKEFGAINAYAGLAKLAYMKGIIKSY